jgi:ubiquinone/menaquinone biosynthesis C-methylase UbiE
LSSFTDRAALQSSAYADATKLAARQAIYQYVERPWPSDGGRVLGALSLRGDERIVDVGCGNGNDLRDLLRAAFEPSQLIGFDLSVGMLRTVAPLGVPVANADAAHLPLRDGAADVALAMHMLYHCPDIEAAARELRRVVRPGGALVVSTNSTGHLRELGEAWEQPAWGRGPSRFTLEDGGMVLATAFTNVELQRTDNRLLIPDVEPVVAYIESVRDGYGDLVDDWDASIAALRERVGEEIRRSGAFAVSVTKGVFVCR